VRTFDPKHWGDMLVLTVSGDVVPKSPATFALARATRKALLDTYAEPGHEDEAPSALRGRGRDAHAAFVPLSFVAPFADTGATRRADGHVMGVAVLLPHASRLPDIVHQRAKIVDGLLRLIGGEVRVPGIGSVTLSAPMLPQTPLTLQETRYGGPARRWTTITPIVHSRYRAVNGSEGLYRQVAAECRDVGLPEPERVEVLRHPALRGAPHRIGAAALPKSWIGPLQGPQAHLDLTFDQPIQGPILLGRARHFGVGLCLPIDDLAVA
jgi:CRISPR-associated protein Csb2